MYGECRSAVYWRHILVAVLLMWGFWKFIESIFVHSGRLLLADLSRRAVVHMTI